jgi:hypothetical protein
MRPRPLWLIALLLGLCLSPACSRPADSLEISLVTPGPGAAVVRVSGLSSSELAALDRARLDAAGWQEVLTITVAGGTGPAVAGRYAVAGGVIEFTPAFALDPGREYDVRFDPARLPQPRPAPALERRVSLPAGPARQPSTVVTTVYPSGDVWPENLLRFYVHFSAPMAGAPSVGFVRLVDDRGEEVPDALLEIDVDLWNGDRTRCTVFFDPGRVKRGILPNRQLGRALEAGRRYAIVIDAAWKDGHGLPLQAAFRREFTAGPAVERGIATADWRIEPPVPGTRDALTVTFAWPLDRALAERTIGVAGPDGRAVAGEVRVEPGETRWRFSPSSPWRTGTHQIVVDPALEDVSGNQIGRAFEIDEFDAAARGPRPDRLLVPFSIGR